MIHLNVLVNVIVCRYFKRRSSMKGPSRIGEDDDLEDMESVASEDFEQYLAENADLDFAADMKPKSKTDKSKKKKKGEEDEEDDDVDAGSESDLDAAECDSEDDFDGDADFQDAFKDFDEMLNDDTLPSWRMVKTRKISKMKMTKTKTKTESVKMKLNFLTVIDLINS